MIQSWPLVWWNRLWSCLFFIEFCVEFSFSPYNATGNFWSKLSELQRGKTHLLICAPKEDSNQTAHLRSLIRVFVVRMKKLCILSYPKCAQWNVWSDSVFWSTCQKAYFPFRQKKKKKKKIVWTFWCYSCLGHRICNLSSNSINFPYFINRVPTVVVWRFHFISKLKRLGCVKTYNRLSTDKRFVAEDQKNQIARFAVRRQPKTVSLHCTGHQSFILDHIISNTFC